MDIISKYIGESGSELTEKLASAGFSVDQAKQFLPEAASGLTEAASQFDMSELIASFTSGDFSALLSKVNIESIASKVGIDSSMVTSGLDSMLPVLAEKFADGGGINSALSSLAGGSKGGILGSLSKLMGK